MCSQSFLCSCTLASFTSKDLRVLSVTTEMETVSHVKDKKAFNSSCINFA